nr:MAG TPA_asm: hypothetical protein [Caudoviricetes sp.]
MWLYNQIIKCLAASRNTGSYFIVTENIIM